MVFSTYLFLFGFLPALLLAYLALPWLAGRMGAPPGRVARMRNLLLTLGSIVFYGWWNPWFILLLLGVTAVNYACGRAISRPGATSGQRFLGVAASVAISLSALGFFKYAVFAQENLSAVLGWLGSDGFEILEVALPVGISFYTFQALSYTIDLYRGTAPPARSFLDFACYISLFPQLVAGPIVRYHTIAGQLVRRSHTLERLSSGIALFILGLSKKLLLANPVGRIADAAFGAEELTAADAWFGAAAYAFQIYFDFSGYSDMAVGLGRMLGFEFPKNFDSPYLAESITDFWRRWHISLSTFLRDYLYIPLGGNRRGPARTYANIAIVMLLGGLWHGASWTFVLWGAYHGTLLISERLLGKMSLYRAAPRPLRVGMTFALVLFSWVLFRSESISGAGRYLAAMLGGGLGGSALTDASGGGLGATLLAARLYGRGSILIMAACALVAFSRLQAHEWAGSVTWRKAVALGPTFCAAVLAMLSQSFNPFLYFQF